MKVSYNWLKEYINIDLPAEKVAEILTDLGLEVSGVEQYASITGGLEGLVVGEVIEKWKHPDADKLSLTKVKIGQDEMLQIVCGAPNVAEGQKVIVAPVGVTIYPLNGEPLTMRKAKIRGEISQGMICAEDEVGLGNSHDGILVLDTDKTPGTPAKELFDVYEDTVIEIDLTPNRIDGAAHYGVARDLKAFLLNTEHQTSNIELRCPNTDGFTTTNEQNPITVEVQDTTACPRYAGLSMKDVEVKDSPAWLQNRLKSIGQKPINNVVDITNYVLHELNQPLHAFDADKITGNKVIVKKLTKGTKFTTLDEAERELHENDLMICDAEKPMCIAGVFGGIHSGVTQETRNVFLESAYFDPVHVRKTAKRHGLNTDASFRFERGVDPNGTIEALKRAALLIQEVAGGEVVGDITDQYPTPIKYFTVEFTYAACNKLVGEEIGADKIKSILTALEIEITKETEEGLTLSVPPYRVDVQRECDVIEEILRVYGYNNVPIPEKVNASLSYSNKPDENKLRATVGNLLTANGFTEIMMNSLTQSGYYNQQETLVKMLNPLSTELDVLRQSLLFGGLETIARNIKHRQENLKLFEYGFCYFKTEDGYKEQANISIIATGRKKQEQWNSSEKPVDFFFVKGIVTALFNKLRLKKVKEQKEENTIQLQANNRTIAEISEVPTATLIKFDIEQPVFYANIYWGEVLQLIQPDTVKFKSLAKYPAVRRDLALLLDKKVEYAAIENLAKSTDSNLLRKVNIFDVYEGKGVEPGKKSYAISFTFQDANQTLTDEVVDGVMKKLQKTFEEKLGATLR